MTTGSAPGLPGYHPASRLGTIVHPGRSGDANSMSISASGGSRTLATAAGPSRRSALLELRTRLRHGLPKDRTPDQRAVALASGRVVIGNDGGVYSQPAESHGLGSWAKPQLDDVHLRYYDAAAGRLGAGTSGAASGQWHHDPASGQINVEPAGGGGYVLVDPANASRGGGVCRPLMYSTTGGGHSLHQCRPDLRPSTRCELCDPGARFIAPFPTDVSNATPGMPPDPSSGRPPGLEHRRRAPPATGHQSTRSAPTASDCPRLGTAIAANGRRCMPRGSTGRANPNLPDHRHQLRRDLARISSPVLPNRFVAGVTVDQRPPRLCGLQRLLPALDPRWRRGVVFKSTNGGRTWRNISGNPAGRPNDALAIVSTTSSSARTSGVFLASASNPTAWRRAPGLTNSAANSVRPPSPVPRRLSHPRHARAWDPRRIDWPDRAARWWTKAPAERLRRHTGPVTQLPRQPSRRGVRAWSDVRARGLGVCRGRPLSHRPRCRGVRGGRPLPCPRGESSRRSSSSSCSSTLPHADPGQRLIDRFGSRAYHRRRTRRHRPRPDRDGAGHPGRRGAIPAQVVLGAGTR